MNSRYRVEAFTIFTLRPSDFRWRQRISLAADFCIYIFFFSYYDTKTATIRSSSAWSLISIDYRAKYVCPIKISFDRELRMSPVLSIDHYSFRSFRFALTNCGSLEITNKIRISVVAEVVSYHVLVNVSSLVRHVDVENYDTFAYMHHRHCNLW